METDIFAVDSSGFIILFVLLAIFLIGLSLFITVVVFWRICSKAGFPGFLGLLILVPFGNIFLPLYLAFADWPALRNENS